MNISPFRPPTAPPLQADAALAGTDRGLASGPPAATEEPLFVESATPPSSPPVSPGDAGDTTKPPTDGDMLAAAEKIIGQSLVSWLVTNLSNLFNQQNQYRELIDE